MIDELVNTSVSNISNFRDKISTVDTKGKRKWMYVHQPQGKLYQWRTYFSLVYLTLFFSLPFIRINDNPIFLFNIPEAKFIFFGSVFFPQDFILFGIGMLVFLLFVIVFTLLFGRVFCGWACPQTIFMEMVFRKIEYWIEGSAVKQQNQNKQKPWPTTLWVKKGIKHLLFLFISFLIANTFLSYVIGVDDLLKIINEPISNHFIGFMAICIFTIVFYAVYAFMRELVCTVACPYGRLQSVLLDKNSVVVAYDYVRGEPRTKKRQSRDVGDCIDCGLCVKVCPTGIDIRNGTQLECIHCSACIDACNMMMHNLNRIPNLIKYASENNIKQSQKFSINYRVKLYASVLILLLGILVALLVTRSQFDATVLRVPGQILQDNNDGTISNLYRIKIINKSNVPKPYRLLLKDREGAIQFIGNRLNELKPGVEQEETFFVKIPKQTIHTPREKLELDVLSGERVIQKKKVSFIGQ